MSDQRMLMWKRRELLALACGATAARAGLAAETVASLRSAGLKVQDFGARFDGRSDDSAALQRALDTAARVHQPLILPSGIARLDRPLDFKGRYVSLIGDPAGGTILKAGARLPWLLDAHEVSDVIDSPLFLYGVSLDGGATTGIGLRLRYRHRTIFDTVTVQGCDTGFEEVDSWLSRRMNCRTRATRTGWRLAGSNHSSVWTGCSFTDASDVHLDIGGDGTARDGNDALLFQACDIEFGAGVGVRVAPLATATFDTCYMGENIGGNVIESAGDIVVRGGALFVGFSATHLGIVPDAGSVLIDNVAIRGQQFGALDRLAGATTSGSGKVVFRSINLQLKIGGNPILQGDILGTQPMPVFAPRLGRAWRATSSGASVMEASREDERTVRCSSVSGADPSFGLAGDLRNTEDARQSGPAFFAIVYRASAPVELRVAGNSAGQGQSRVLGTMPKTQNIATYVKADVPVEFAQYQHVELVMRGREGDQITLIHATVGDGSTLAPGLMANLAKAI